MNINRTNQIPLIFATLVLASGISYDSGLVGTSSAFMVLSVFVLVWMLLRYLEGTRPSHSLESVVAQKSKPS